MTLRITRSRHNPDLATLAASFRTPDHSPYVGASTGFCNCPPIFFCVPDRFTYVFIGMIWHWPGPVLVASVDSMRIQTSIPARQDCGESQRMYRDYRENGTCKRRRHNLGMHSGVLLTCLLLAFPAAQPARAEPSQKMSDDVELAIEAGLHWLASQQVKDGGAAGSWSSPKYPTAVTGLAGLAFLANGHLPGEGNHGVVVERAMKYVQSSMTSDGYAGSIGDSMYVHAICTLFALSYLGMHEDAEKDAELAQWCRKAINVIVSSQKVPKAKAEKGGWRYSPHTHESDLSVASWQLLCLHAARQCGYSIDDSVINFATGYVNSGFVRTKDGQSGFAYRPGRSTVPEYGVTGTCVLLKGIFENQVDDKMSESLKYLKSFEIGWGGSQYRGYFFISTWYLMQGFFQMGGTGYEEFAGKTRKVLVKRQKGDGHWPYPSQSSAHRQGVGPVFPTTLAILILSLDGQYLPIFQRQRSLFR